MRRAGGTGRKRRLRPRAVFLDGGGTIVLPNRQLVAGTFARMGIDIDPASVPRAHYAAARMLDQARSGGVSMRYVDAFCAALGVELPAAVAVLAQLDDRTRSGKVLWSEPAPGAIASIAALRGFGIDVLVVTNSDGHAAENLRDAGLLRATGLVYADVIDSSVVGSSKPDGGIFEAALARVRVLPGDAVHVGDMLSTDVVGARAAGIAPIHLDPGRACRQPDHRHIRSLAGIWSHVEVRPGYARMG